MGRLNRLLRKAVNWKNQKRLKNRDFSLLSSNCNGVFILHDLGLRFNSPTVNLWITPMILSDSSRSPSIIWNRA